MKIQTLYANSLYPSSYMLRAPTFYWNNEKDSFECAAAVAQNLIEILPAGSLAWNLGQDR